MKSDEFIANLLKMAVDDKCFDFSAHVLNDCTVLGVIIFYDLIKSVGTPRFEEIFGKKSEEEVRNKITDKGFSLEKTELKRYRKLMYFPTGEMGKN